MRVCVLIHELGRSGGAQTVLRYARGLDGAELVVTDPRAGDLPADEGGVPVRRLAEVRGERYDCAVATWWATSESLWEVEAATRIVFLQSLEGRFYEERHFYERFAAEAVLTLPVGYVVVAPWMRDVLAELRPDAPVAVVRNGIDKQVFGPRGSVGHFDAESTPPLRVLVEGQPSQRFKSVHEALAAVDAMTEPAEATVVANDPGSAGDLGDVRLVGGLDAAGMAALYGEHDVLLKLSRVEGLPLPPLEAFHMGVPAVVAPFTGHEEYVEHGRNGLVVGYDDVPGTARALDGLARDRGRLRELSTGALATAAAWPSAETATAEFAAAVAGMCAGPPPDPAPALVHLERARRRWLELGREHSRQEEALNLYLRGSLDWYEHAYAQAVDEVEALNERLRIADRDLRHAQRQIEEIKESRAYKAAVAARRLRPGGRR